jgi:hypothetical protein
LSSVFSTFLSTLDGFVVRRCQSKGCATDAGEMGTQFNSVPIFTKIFLDSG